MPAEEVHKAGRDGLHKAKLYLDRVLGGAINLLYNAYDHPKKVRFDTSGDLGTFSFDWRGYLTRPDSNAMVGGAAADVFIEVKNYAQGKDLLDPFRQFLKRASYVALTTEHHDTWFVYFVTVPFGCTIGAALCDGRFLAEEAKSWPSELQASSSHLSNRVAVVINTASETRLIDAWWSSVQSRGQAA